MKGFRTGTKIDGIVYGEAELQVSPNGRAVVSWPVIQGGDQQKGFKGYVVRCVVFGAKDGNADDGSMNDLLKAVALKGMACSVEGLLYDRARESGDKIYANVSLNVFRLKVQLSKDATELTEIVVRKGNGKRAGKVAETEKVAASK